jgi:Cu-Zn family superoxide dismutase
MRQRVAVIVLGSVTLACSSPQYRATNGDVQLPPLDAAGTVVIRSSTGERLGALDLIPTPDGRLRLRGTLAGIPRGTHGIHLHAIGRCEPPGFESTGGHFNPTSRQHGLENAAGPHAGDAPNIEAGGDGRAAIDIVLAAASLDPSNAAFINDADGAAVVIHASADDQRTDPSGNSGARIACGVVGAR